MEEKELLKNILDNKKPTLFIGAGFSLGAVNKKGKEIPLAENLALELYEKILAEKLSKEEELEVFKDDIRKRDLKYVCDILDLKKLNNERNKYLTERFKGCRCEKDDYHMLLKRYQWQTIFSLNIDDFVEFIYENEINVQMRGGEKERGIQINYIKLHGSVNNPEYGYVFNEKEYQRSLSQESWAISYFGTEFFRNDIIFLGTEFQENDLHTIINKFADSGAVTHAYNYFFITPQINDAKFKMVINANSNYHHIPMTTEEFLEFINSEIVIKNTHKSFMINQGALFLSDFKKVPSYLESGQLYQGSIPQFSDFFGDWDIRYPKYSNWVNEIKCEDQNLVISLYGETYSGKSCVAMRIATDLYNSGYFVFSFSLRSDLDATQYARIILDYLKTLKGNEKCVILAENMAHFYPNIKYIIENSPQNIKQLIFIVTADKETHLTKKYIFEKYTGFIEHYIAFTINDKYANNIYDKLEEKSHLNNLLKYADGRKQCIRYIQHINDIIEVLYISQEGRKFGEHFAFWIKQTTSQELCDKKAFEALCFIGELGVYEIPAFCFKQIMESLGLDINYDAFYNRFKDYLQIDNGIQKIRCLRIIKSQVLKELSEYDKYQIIYNVARYFAPKLQDRTESISAKIFQNIIKVKRLTDKKIISNKLILELLFKLEDKAKHLSYYWIQRGIANRNIDNFEEANNSFTKAADVRGYLSYNIQHAQAKNYMAWGVCNLISEKEDPLKIFDKGRGMMRNLIENSPRGYFVYSVHSYTDMIIKYSQVTGDIPNKYEIDFIVNCLNSIPLSEEDDYSNQIIETFRKFCIKNNIVISSLKKSCGSDEMFIDIDDIGNE